MRRDEIILKFQGYGYNLELPWELILELENDK